MTPQSTSYAGQIILAVFAHPDDESLACGGTLARLVDAGAHVVVMCASRGERGANGGHERDESVARLRATELRSAADALGVQELVLLNHPDGELRWTDVTDFSAELVLFIRHRRPAAVITFDEDGLYWHPDHIGVHERVLTACRSLGGDAPPIYAVTMARGVMTGIVEQAQSGGWIAPDTGFWSLQPDAFGKCAVPYTMSVDVADWVPQKLDAIEAHRSQMGEAHPFARLSAPDARRWLGREYFRRLDVPSRGTTVLEELCTPIS